VNARHLVLKQRSIADVCQPAETTWQCTHGTPVARLTMVLAWPQPRRAKDRPLPESNATKFSVAMAGFAVLLMFAIALLGTMYARAILLEEGLSSQHYNQPQVQYSDVWKWQGHR
jgi:hypothetical protein